MCQEFSCLPSDALREWQHADCGAIEEVLEALAYGQAWSMARSASPEARKRMTGGLFDVVTDIEFALVQEELDRGR
jgi:hypothetical protein